MDLCSAIILQVDKIIKEEENYMDFMGMQQLLIQKKYSSCGEEASVTKVKDKYLWRCSWQHTVQEDDDNTRKKKMKMLIQNKYLFRHLTWKSKNASEWYYYINLVMLNY